VRAELGRAQVRRRAAGGAEGLVVAFEVVVLEGLREVAVVRRVAQGRVLRGREAEAGGPDDEKAHRMVGSHYYHPRVLLN